MSAFRLSPLRSKGWLRLGLLGSLAMVPLTAMHHALGYFNAGELGLQQAAEYLAAGIFLSMSVTGIAAWVARGFAVRVKEEEDEQDEPRRPTPALAAPHSKPAEQHKPVEHKPQR